MENKNHQWCYDKVCFFLKQTLEAYETNLKMGLVIAAGEYLEKTKTLSEIIFNLSKIK